MCSGNKFKLDFLHCSQSPVAEFSQENMTDKNETYAMNCFSKLINAVCPSSLFYFFIVSRHITSIYIYINLTRLLGKTLGLERESVPMSR